MLTVTNSNKH